MQDFLCRWRKLMRGLGALTAGTVLAAASSCGVAPTPFVVTGPGGAGNDPPSLEILEPIQNITRGQGDPFVIRWTDADRDNNAKIRFSLESTTSSASILLVEGIDENDSIGPDVFVVSTTLIPPGTYNLVGVIDDGVNSPVQTFASVAGAATAQRVVITIVEPGTGPQTVPPRVAVVAPTFNLSVAQDDTLTITVQPTLLPPAASRPYDPDSEVRLFVVLDRDQNPNNDDPANPDPNRIIVLEERTLQAETFDAITLEERIDTATIPPLPGGDPYFIRATVSDATNPPVHSYAVGNISVVRLAAGSVDLFDIGRTLSGALFKGFNPQAQLGYKVATASDFDADGVEDFVMVARFGNPANVGPVGEAYLVYGQGSPLNPGTRFGGTIPVNSIADPGAVSGVIFQAPPVRATAVGVGEAFTEGITDVSFVPDQNADGRPEIIFGLPRVHGAWDSTDYDPGDSDVDFPGFCYPDFLVNNFTDQPDRTGGTAGLADVGFYAGGMAVLVNSTNRDTDGVILTDGVATRLENTVVSLELTGHFQLEPLDAEGRNASGNIFVRASNGFANNQGNDDDEPGRTAGARFIGGGFDHVFQFEDPRADLWGYHVGFVGDLNSDLLAEIVVSAPLNERYLADLEPAPELGFSPHLDSTIFNASITILPGQNYNDTQQRDIPDETGTSITPFLDQHVFPPFGSCAQNPGPRGYVLPSDSISIFAEDVDDFLYDGQSAGDFNQDGLGDILCGAPLNDRTSNLADTGAMYVIYGRTTFGEIQLSHADNPRLRPPMLRLRGNSPNDQLGWRQTAGLDVNGDRIDDVFVASPHTDFGGITRSTCAADFNQDGQISDADLVLRSFDTCVEERGSEVFTDDACKAFDFNNDGKIDEADRCVFCCLSDDCNPASDCTIGTTAGDCCDNLVDNGFAGVVFGGREIDGDRTLSQLATSQLPGVVFFGGQALDRAGHDISSAGDFNQDGFGDILITAPGRSFVDNAGRERRGVVYLIFGGTHLINQRFNLDDVGTAELPGIIFFSPYVAGRPNEAAPTSVAFIGDINADGFDDIAVGNPLADFIDPSFPQGPDAPGTDPATGRRSNVGDVYIIYGNNFGSNRLGG